MSNNTPRFGRSCLHINTFCDEKKKDIRCLFVDLLFFSMLEYSQFPTDVMVYLVGKERKKNLYILTV